ncbi:MAG: hypothetical protein A3H97_07305 [Acidobacteria bacterium RIFCSPLOWO2_02_FULL_65_29]|nr:MAG: hypothetical protein A3H97_07305 [Acidobacteria bacterium RIFCSPLOWO2_02_FULL_65_29]
MDAMAQQIKHFGTSGEIAVLIDDVNKWLSENDGKLEVVAVSESQGGRLGDEADPFYYCMNVVYRTL